MKTEITKEEAIQGIKNLFDIDKNEVKDAYYSDGTFGVNKKYMERDEVVSKLVKYFQDKMFVVGYGLEIRPITLVYTTFKVVKI